MNARVLDLAPKSDKRRTGLAAQEAAIPLAQPLLDSADHSTNFTFDRFIARSDPLLGTLPFVRGLRMQTAIDGIRPLLKRLSAWQ